METITDDSFGMQWDFWERRAARGTLRDKLAIAHNSMANFAFAKDRRAIRAPRNDAVMAGSGDILWMQRHAAWRER